MLPKAKVSVVRDLILEAEKCALDSNIKEGQNRGES